jgi:hypothetical protein
MTPEVQFIAITAFLIWGLVSSVSGLFTPSATEGQLVWREHTADGWQPWRPAHFGLTNANLRALNRSDGELAETDRAELLETVLHQAGRPDADAVQFAVVRRSPEPVYAEADVVFVSEQVAVAADRWGVAAGAA